MRKTTWIGLGIAMVGSSLFMGVEHLRDREMQNPQFFNERTTSLSKPLFHVTYTVQRLEWNLLSLWFRLRGEETLHPDIRIVGIDDASLKSIGEWPWSRAVHAKLIQLLSKHPPKAFLFDVIFAEPMNRDPKGDAALAVLSKANPWVVHAFYAERLEGFNIINRQNPYPELTRQSNHIASVNASVDPDGILRRALIEQFDQGSPEYLLSVVGAAMLQGKDPSEVVKAFPRTRAGHLLVNYVGKENKFPYIPYEVLLTNEEARKDLEGKVVLLGSVAIGTFDHYPTPFSPMFPGLNFHANVIHNSLNHNALRVASQKWIFGFMALVFLWSACGLVKLSPGWGTLGSFGVAGLMGMIVFYVFSRHFIYVESSSAFLTLVFNFITILLFRFFTEEKEKRWVKGVFGQYVSPKVLDALMEDPSKLWLGGERREMTMFFSDVAGFTSFSERMKPEKLVELLNRYLTAMGDEIFRFDGYLNKFMGDGIMAFWNAPVKQPNHAELACRAALSCQETLKKFNEQVVADGGVPLVTRIGIDTGYVVVGNMGTKQKMDFTVMGDHVNLASRLEGANKVFGTHIMISEFVYEVVQSIFDVRYLDVMRVPGKAKPVRVYELLAEKDQAPTHWKTVIPAYHEAVQLYANQSFEEAVQKFKWVDAQVPGGDRVSQTYLSRCERFIQAPPAKDWDGVYDVKVK